MRQSQFTAVYDACVLYPAPLRDFLMWLGLSGRFRARSEPVNDFATPGIMNLLWMVQSVSSRSSPWSAG